MKIIGTIEEARTYTGHPEIIDYWHDTDISGFNEEVEMAAKERGDCPYIFSKGKVLKRLGTDMGNEEPKSAWYIVSVSLNGKREYRYYDVQTFEYCPNIIGGVTFEIEGGLYHSGGIRG